MNPESVPRRALLMVAKQPTPGQTKTRLCPPLTAEQAASLYECFLRDTIDLIRAARQQIDFERMLVYLPLGSEAYFRALASDFALLLQEGNDLSARLNHATTHALMQGYHQVVIMDSDSPTLPFENLVRSFMALDEADVSLGPCDDGGYYLIGLKQPAPPLFLNVTMSTDHVTADTLAQAHAAHLTTALLPTCYDIDYAADLQRLAAELTTLSPSIAAHTRSFLARYPALVED
jgi:uncharacterized protein